MFYLQKIQQLSWQGGALLSNPESGDARPHTVATMDLSGSHPTGLSADAAVS